MVFYASAFIARGLGVVAYYRWLFPLPGASPKASAKAGIRSGTANSGLENTFSRTMIGAPFQAA
jgi:hypothetical protein